MCRRILSTVLVTGLSAVLWFPREANAQTSAAPAAPAATRRQPTVSETYLQGYLIMLEGDTLRRARDFAGAYFKYRDARDAFDSVPKVDASWNPEIIQYRRKKIRESMEEVRQDEIQRRADGGGPPPQGLIEAAKKNNTGGEGPETMPTADPPGGGRAPLALLEDGINPLHSPIEASGTGSTDPSWSRPADGGTARAPLAAALPPDTATAAPPVITATALEDHRFTASFTTIAGFSYQLESSTDLTGWTPQGATVTGDGTEKSISADVTGTGRRFFRISRVP